MSFYRRYEFSLIEFKRLKKEINTCELYFKKTGKKSDFDIIKNISILFSVYDLLLIIKDKQHLLKNSADLLISIINYYNNPNGKDVKSILDVIIIRNADYNFVDNKLHRRLCSTFSQYFKDIDILKHISNFSVKIGLNCFDNDMYSCLCDEIISNLLKNIYSYDENMLNDKIKECKQIIANFNTLNYTKLVCKIANFLCEKQVYLNKPEFKAEYEIISKLHNYVFYELNLLNTIEYNKSLQEILDKYK